MKAFSKIRLSKGTILELLFLILLLIFSYLLREKPSPSFEKGKAYKGYNQGLLKVTSEGPKAKPSEKKAEKLNSPQSLNYTQILQRNPFTPEGSYYPTPIPEIPFTLIAVKSSPPPSRAVLKSFTGEILLVKKGDKLFDGSKVVEIKEKAVILERLGKKRELKIFSVEVEKWKPKSSF